MKYVLILFALFPYYGRAQNAPLTVFELKEIASHFSEATHPGLVRPMGVGGSGDACDINPLAPGCPEECNIDPTSPGCPESCDIDPTSYGCPEACDINPTADGCPESCDINPMAPGCQEACDINPSGPFCNQDHPNLLLPNSTEACWCYKDDSCQVADGTSNNGPEACPSTAGSYRYQALDPNCHSLH